MLNFEIKLNCREHIRLTILIILDGKVFISCVETAVHITLIISSHYLVFLPSYSPD